jgi:HEPN domain-containing protein
VTRSEFQQLADVRIDEAGVLLAAGKWDGAYYLAGYAVECALKACIAKLTKADDFPDKDRAAKAWTHKLDELITVADLRATRLAQETADPDFAKNWDAVKKWNEGVRYERKSDAEARALHDAIADPAHGVLTWIKRHW